MFQIFSPSGTAVFIYGLFIAAASSSDYEMTNERMISE
jgi:hypothetical protein